MDEPQSTALPDTTGTARWLDDARTTFAARIRSLLDSVPEAGADILLGYLPVGLARSLLDRLECDAPGPASTTEGRSAIAAGARISDPERLASLPIGRLFDTMGVAPALAPHFALLTVSEQHHEFAPLFAFLHDDAQRRYVTPALLARLAGEYPSPVHELLAADGPLRALELVSIEGGDSRLLGDTSIHWKPAIARWLLGELPFPDVDPLLAGHLVTLPDAPLDALFARSDTERLVRAADTSLLVLIGEPGSGRALAAQAMARLEGRDPLIIDGRSVSTDPNAGQLIRIALRDAALRGESLVVTNAETIPTAILRSALAHRRSQVVLTSGDRLDLEVPQLAIPPIDDDRSRVMWRHMMSNELGMADQLAHRFRLAATDVIRIGQLHQGDDIDTVAQACLERSARTLDRLAMRLDSRYEWADLILPSRQTQQLQGLTARITHGRQVYEDWGFGDKLAPNRGLVALFSGPSGTGKTMSAGLVSSTIGLPLYRVDLSATVSKYIGETEKNLEAIFRAAEAGNAALFFDECDALFGKRGEINDAHDRYANLESSYLLQRLEQHRGVVMMASNHPQNIDDAFTRRIDVTVEFPMPDAGSRQRLWHHLLPIAADASVDADFLGDRFELSGGSIRNCLLGAAFLAAEERVVIETGHCVRAVAEEYQKLGIPLTRTDFGEAFADVRVRNRG